MMTPSFQPPLLLLQAPFRGVARGPGDRPAATREAAPSRRQSWSAMAKALEHDYAPTKQQAIGTGFNWA